ncbi:MAG TPA: hypothetical protein RMH80_02030, partial [Polyangiaceae bacterium LLY-WYZ-15_(1-7)]|nr:hypothetical protein [Polyangiaceae bacterium LLY-WYZ-15_(1-7)]
MRWPTASLPWRASKRARSPLQAGVTRAASLPWRASKRAVVAAASGGRHARGDALADDVVAVARVEAGGDRLR